MLIGGGGYVGTELQKYLAVQSYEVKVYDTFWYPAGRWPYTSGDFVSRIQYIHGDVRDLDKLKESLDGVDYVIHLACVSNDPSYELNPQFSKEVNFDSFVEFVSIAKKAPIKRLIYASSSSVYGVKAEPNVTEDLSCEPRTDYSRYKVMCEEILHQELSNLIPYTIVRPSTICGYSRRQRFDLVVNALTISGLVNKKIRVEGGDQYRPNLHMSDMLRAYELLLNVNLDLINKETFNIAGENLSVRAIAEKVRGVLGTEVEIETIPVIDDRSYRVSGEKIRNKIGFTPLKTVEDAVRDLKQAYINGFFNNVADEQYFNIQVMKKVLN